MYVYAWRVCVSRTGDSFSLTFALVPFVCGKIGHGGALDSAENKQKLRKLHHESCLSYGIDQLTRAI